MLELVPSEIDRVLVPIASTRLDVYALDKAVRSKPIDDLIEENGAVILGSLGVAKADTHLLMNSWRKLRNRRHRTTVTEYTG